MAEEKQQIELDLEETQDTEIELESQKEDEQPQVEAQTDTEDQFEKAESNTQKRIDRLTKKMREAERQREEAIKYAQGVQSEAQKLQERMNALDTNYVNEYSTRVETQMGTAEQELARAIEVGDTNGVVEAQRKITSLAIENDRAKQAKIQQERYAQQVAAQQQQQVQQQQPVEQKPDAKAEKWAEKNSWFGQDEAMTFAAFGLHKKMVEEEGFDPQSDEYYSELDSRIHNTFPQKFNTAPSKKTAQTVAGVSRNTGNGRNNKKVRLTPSQVTIAKRLGVPLEEYAKYVKE